MSRRLTSKKTVVPSWYPDGPEDLNDLLDFFPANLESMRLHASNLGVNFESYLRGCLKQKLVITEEYAGAGCGAAHQ